jgi:hypothetical protein
MFLNKELKALVTVRVCCKRETAEGRGVSCALPSLSLKRRDIVVVSRYKVNRENPQTPAVASPCREMHIFC